MFNDPATDLPGYFQKGAPVGADGFPLCFSDRVWGSTTGKTYGPPHDEGSNYGSATPFIADIRAKFEKETDPKVDRMRGPIHRQ